MAIFAEIKNRDMLEEKRILAGRILVKPLKESETTSSGLIYKPINVIKNKPFAGEVVLLGKDLPTLPTEIKIGDRVLYPAHSSVSLIIDDEEYKLINKSDVLLIW